MIIRSFQSEDALQWDDFCRKSYSSTFLHNRRFISYHIDRFEDLSLIIEDDNRKWLGLLPAAKHPTKTDVVVSHPGISYGGVLHQGALRGESMVEAFQAIIHYYKVIGLKRLLYKVVPYIYHQVPDQDDLYTLFRLNAKRYRTDLSCSIDLLMRLPLSERRRRSYKKAIKAGTVVLEGREFDHHLWRILEENLARKYGVCPVHTLQEIRLLTDRFPENICFVVGIIDDQIEAGVVLFKTPTVSHAQYIASSEKGYAVCALDMIFEYCITHAIDEKIRWFDFGISNEQNGLVLNKGLYRFKSEFGGGGIAHEFYELEFN